MKQDTLDSYQVDGEICPACGDEFSTLGGLRTHYGHVHNGSLVPTETCDECGSEFKCGKGRVGNFCSKECQMERRRREGLPARARQVTITCDGCGDEFSVPQSDAELGKRYCSNECYYSDSEGEDVECEWCGEYFHAYGKYANEARFCSQDCYGEHLSEELTKENHPRYKGEDKLSDPPDYGPGWNPAKRARVRERDNHECVSCGIGSEDHINQYGRRLNVHHESPARGATNPAVYNAMRNLTTLCVSCHQQEEARLRRQNT